MDHGYDDVLECARLIRGAVRGRLRTPELIVIVSPHGDSTGVTTRGAGSLNGFGLAEFSIDIETDEGAAKDLAAAWARPVLEVPLDHGVVVPLLLLRDPHVPVVPVAFGEVTGSHAHTLEEVLDDASDLAHAITVVFGGREVAVIVSAHTSAALSPRAPLLDRPAGHRLHEGILRALSSDVGMLSDVPLDLWSEAGSCGAGPLALAARLWEGRRAAVEAECSPAGVGYVVATVDE